MDVKKIQAAVQWMKQGGLVIVADDEDRESEGDIIGLGSKVTPQKSILLLKQPVGCFAQVLVAALPKDST